MQSQRTALEQIRDRVRELPEAIEIARQALATTPSEDLKREERAAVITAIENAPEDPLLREAARKLRMEEAWEQEAAKELVT